MDESYIKPLIALALGLVAVLLFVISMVRGFDFFNHYRRYRRHLLNYPASKTWKGDIWKKTR